MKIFIILFLCQMFHPFVCEGKTDPYISTLIKESDKKGLHLQNIWLSMNFYNSMNRNIPKSEILNNDYFLSYAGKYSPKDEIEATIKTVFGNNNIDDNECVPCIYINRYTWLRRNLSNSLKETDKHLDKNCKKYTNWLRDYGDSEISFVIVTEDDSDIASSFGHTLISLSPKSGKPKIFLNYGVPESIASKDGNLYRNYKAIRGKLKGTFEIIKIHNVKIKYTYQGRKLKEYPIKLTGPEKKFLLSHIFSLTKGYTSSKLKKNAKTRYNPESIYKVRLSFNYGFLQENCAYQIFNVIESVKPQLRRYFYKDNFRTIKPYTVFKILKKEGIIDAL